MKSKYFKSIIYALCMVIFFTLTYVFIYEGLNIKTKIYIYYQEKSTFNYDEIIKDNNIENIKINYNYQNTFTENISGYYKYNIILELLSYENNKEIKEEFTLLEDKVKVINESINKINIDDDIEINYSHYKNLLEDKKGKINIRINIYSYLNFESISGDYPIENTILLEIPLEDNPEIIGNNIDSNNKLYDFSTKQDVNYLNIFIGIICLSIAITFLIQVIKTMICIYNKEINYKIKLTEILKKYDNKIVNVKKFYNIKKYNLIYVDSFEELLDVQNTYKVIINYREMKKNKKAIFIIINEKNAWIYVLNEK